MTERPLAEAFEITRALIAERFADCLLAILAGSLVRGEATATSDLDLVILLPGPPAPYRESFILRGWPIEAFVHTEASLARFFEQDARRRRPSLPMMCAEGLVIVGSTALAADVKERARQLLEAGPPPLGEEGARDYRYRLTDLLDDLEGATDPDEVVFIAAELATELARFVFDYERQWRGKGKWLVRALRHFDPAFAEALSDALRAFYGQGEKETLIALVQRRLEPVGGRLFDGYRLEG